MRQTFKYTMLAAAAVAMMSSCKGFLDTESQGEILPETTEDYASMLYYHLEAIDTGDDEYSILSYKEIGRIEAFADNLNASLATKTSFYLPISTGAFLGTLGYRYMNYYDDIAEINIVLENIADDTSEEGDKVRAIALAMRGILYYNLMRHNCPPYNAANEQEILGVPLVSEFNIEAEPNRGNIKQTAEFIIKDLKAAIALNMTDEKYLLTTDVAKAFLAKTYFWSQQWDKAIECSDDLLERYPLVEGDEYVAMIQSFHDKLGSMIFHANQNTKSTVFKNLTKTYSRYRPVSVELYKLFAEKENDIRYKTFFDNKLLNTKTISSKIRSDEMALVIAESYAHLGDNDKALEYLNLLRSKRISNYTPLTMATLPAVDPDALITVDATGEPLTPLMSAILNERRKELYMEGDRWYELKRNGTPEFWVGYNGVKYETKSYMYTYPIDFYDVYINENLEQNEGYE